MLAEAARAASNTVVTALRNASAVTGTDFRYLLGTAMRESGLKPEAQSSHSSASGLFQFVEQTWYGLLKEFGAKHGLTSYANAIERGDDGRFHACCTADRHAILDLRNDPQVSAIMAGEYARQTQQVMQNKLGRQVCAGELYAAHLLGPGSACRLIRTNESSPETAAADLFPRAAEANKHVFYHTDGTPKSVREVYNWTVKQSAPSLPAATAGTAVASATTPTFLTTDNTAALIAAMWGSQANAVFGGKASSPYLLAPSVLSILSTVAKDHDAT